MMHGQKNIKLLQTEYTEQNIHNMGSECE